MFCSGCTGRSRHRYSEMCPPQTSAQWGLLYKQNSVRILLRKNYGNQCPATDGAKISQWEPNMLYLTQVKLHYILSKEVRSPEFKTPTKSAAPLDIKCDFPIPFYPLFPGKGRARAICHPFTLLLQENLRVHGWSCKV